MPLWNRFRARRTLELSCSGIRRGPTSGFGFATTGLSRDNRRSPRRYCGRLGFGYGFAAPADPNGRRFGTGHDKTQRPIDCHFERGRRDRHFGDCPRGCLRFRTPSTILKGSPFRRHCRTKSESAFFSMRPASRRCRPWSALTCHPARVSGLPTVCMALAGHPFDPNRIGAGVLISDIQVDKARAVCEAANQDGHEPKYLYSLYRIAVAENNAEEAKGS